MYERRDSGQGHSVGRGRQPSVATRWEGLLRWFLGLLLVCFSVNALFLQVFVPEVPPEGAELLGAMRASGYLLPLVQSIELAVGVLLLANRWTLLAVLALLPISVNIVLFHGLLAPPLLGPGLVVFLSNLGLIFAWRRPLSVLLHPVAGSAGHGARAQRMGQAS